MRPPYCLCACVYTLLTFERLNQSLWNLVCIHDAIWAQLNGILHKSLPLVACLYVYPPMVARQRAGKNLTAATNTSATIELLTASSSMRLLSYQKEVSDWFFPELPVLSNKQSNNAKPNSKHVRTCLDSDVLILCGHCCFTLICSSWQKYLLKRACRNLFFLQYWVLRSDKGHVKRSPRSSLALHIVTYPGNATSN
jgi:hypothetical protein